MLRNIDGFCYIQSYRNDDLRFIRIIAGDDDIIITVNNFVGLTRSNFYDGLIFHRVVDGFVIQDGDPLGTGYGGSGTTIPLEIHPELNYNVADTLGMARSTDPNSASSQYFITLVPTPNLNGNYAVFGYVIVGMDVVQDIGNVPVNGNDHPLEDVFIDSIRILSPNILLFDPPERDLEISSGEEVFFMVIAADLPINYVWQYDGNEIGDNSSTIPYIFNDGGDHQIICTVSGDSEYDYVKTWNINVSGSSQGNTFISINDMKLSNYPNPFNPSTTISFSLTSENTENTELTIYNLKGHNIRKYSILNLSLL
ncbi:MAG: peptidylprolyl isomerase [Candidatus Cloacimonetes bacterium]|nr:peptidylprolyl isomerase [Candidatus Cloacimonadota bacterium]